MGLDSHTREDIKKYSTPNPRKYLIKIGVIYNKINEYYKF